MDARHASAVLCGGLALAVAWGCSEEDQRARTPERNGTPAASGSGAAPASTTPSPADLPTLTAHAYVCGDEYVVTKLEEDGSLWIFLPDQTIQLQHTPAASGARYADGSVVFWSKGVEAVLIRDGTEATCVEDRHASLVEDAKLRGMDFRGTGNEPPWILEMGPDSIMLYTGYEANRHAFPAVPPVTDQQARVSVWETVDADGGTLRVQLSVPADGRRCQDSMADRTYETHVELLLDGQLLRGCGNALH
jgi:membrane-bound inhibitor of C-type lysozyme